MQRRQRQCKTMRGDVSDVNAVGLEHVGALCGLEMYDSKPSMLPHLTLLL
jgi:hypothetical protein